MSAETITFTLPPSLALVVTVDLDAPVGTRPTARAAAALDRGARAAVPREAAAATIDRNHPAGPLDRSAASPVVDRESR
ncbi:MAG: hypothetical protein H0T51_06675 [Pirellulales bacterium]|nr:hypothetical protein [Pirellulales bacterium]